MIYEEKLNEIAMQNVGSLVYPDPTDVSALQAEITEKNGTITGMRNETVSRPAEYNGYTGRQAYQEYLKDLQSEITDLQSQITVIRESDSDARAQAETDHAALIEAEKLKEEVIAEATRLTFEEDYKTRLDAVESALLDLGEALL